MIFIIKAVLNSVIPVKLFSFVSYFAIFHSYHGPK